MLEEHGLSCKGPLMVLLSSLYFDKHLLDSDTIHIDIEYQLICSSVASG